MQVYGIGSCKTIDQFVNMQMSALRKREQTFESVFELMFSNPENIMFETTDGNKIFKIGLNNLDILSNNPDFLTDDFP